MKKKHHFFHSIALLLLFLNCSYASTISHNDTLVERNKQELPADATNKIDLNVTGQNNSNEKFGDTSDDSLFYPADESDSSALKIANAISKAKSNKKAKTQIADAQKEYQKAVDSLKKKDYAVAKKHFNILLKELEHSAIEPEIYYFLLDDIGSIVAKLKSFYEADENSDLSQNLSGSIPMTTKNRSLIENYISIYSNGKSKERVTLALERSGAYKNIVLQSLRKFDLPEELFYLPVVESLYNAEAVSRAGATGMWQIMSHRGRALGLQINYWIDERLDPERSTQAACLYLKQLYVMLNDWHLVLAAYNRGEYGLLRDMKFSNAVDVSEMVARKAIPKETQNYVPQFIAAVTIGKNLKQYGFKNLNYAQPLVYDKYVTNEVVDLKIIAKCAETTLEEIKKLNPALKAWCTPHGYPNFEVKIPYGSKSKFLENIKNIPDLNPSPGLIKHKVAEGEYLGKIARTYSTSVKAIHEDNRNLAKKKSIKIGETIIIRPGKNYFK
ncbi:MAG: transglycosylase SLT domain-containing protein [Elusimicrobiota bacterium]|jgi:membrane-bound lytic murein transglycosylase D|nr:transglycosylase SLT domain-containing protein [Elusimicrobiota bacterium]